MPPIRWYADPDAAWDADAASLSPSLFLTSRWVHAVAAGWRRPIACVRIGDDPPRGLAAGVLMGYPLLRIWYSMLPFGGIVGPAAGDPEAWARILDDLRRRGCAQAQWVPEEPAAPPPVAARVVRSIGYRRALPSGADKLWEGLDRRRRSDVRRAERDGVAIAGDDDLAAARALAALQRQTMREHRARLRYGRDLLEVIAARLGREDRSFIVAAHDGRPVAGALVLYSGVSAYLLVAATSRAGRACGAGEVVLARALEAAAARGMRAFDFMGTPPGDAAVAGWKEKWGGVSREMTRCVVRLAPLRGALVDLALDLTAGRPRPPRRHFSP